MTNATNHKGWEVQLLTDEGWKAVSTVATTKAEAEQGMRELKGFFLKAEFRVYEAVA